MVFNIQIIYLDKMKMSSTHKKSIILSLVGSLVLVSIILIFNGLSTGVDADTGSASYSVTISNLEPSISDVKCCFRDTGGAYEDGNCYIEGEAWTPSEGTNYDMLCNFTVTDPNGYQDMADGWVNSTWYHEYVTWNSPLDMDVKYINSSCENLTGSGTGNTIIYECEFMDIKYWADGGEWSLLINSSDGIGFSIPYNANITVDNITTIWQTSSINFGSMSLGQNGSFGDLGNADVASITNNTGNTRISIEVNSVDQQMNCTVGDIVLTSIEYDGDSGGTMESACGQLTSSASWDTDCNAGEDVITLEDCTNTCPNLLSLDYTYWGITIPTSGVGGTCQVQVIFTATQSA